MACYSLCFRAGVRVAKIILGLTFLLFFSARSKATQTKTYCATADQGRITEDKSLLASTIRPCSPLAVDSDGQPLPSSVARDLRAGHRMHVEKRGLGS